MVVDERVDTTKRGGVQRGSELLGEEDHDGRSFLDGLRY